MTPLRCLIRMADKAIMPLPVVDRPDSVRSEGGGGMWLSDDSCCIAGPWGMIVGRLFARGDNRPILAMPSGLPTAADARVMATWLTENCWGAWIAVFSEARTRKTFIARDPSTHLPTYTRKIAGGVLLATDVSLLVAGGAPDVAVSWPDLEAHLRYPEMRQSRTCLGDISEIPPGSLTALGESEATPLPLWYPWQFVHAGPPSELTVSAAEVRKNTVACVSAWADLGGRVAVSASGGLDSSIICASLVAAGHPFDCVTVATPDPSGDESAHVRHLADALGVRMAVRTFDPANWALDKPASRGLPRPTRKAFMVELRNLLADACSDFGADTIFDGNGGDNLFCYLHSAAPIVDRLSEEGMSRGVLSTFLDMCRITECDMMTMGRATAKQIRGGKSQVWRADERLLNPPGSFPTPLTFWWGDHSRRLPGKTAHISLIQRSQNFEHGLGWASGPVQLSALMSQPLIESSLAIPTWQWSAGGINRALARQAFYDDLPEATLTRRSKAGPDSAVRAVVGQNRGMMRDMLLGGLLAEHGVLNAAETQSALAIDEHSNNPIIYRLLDVVEAEAWARSWM
jgi:asparagine synthase (glutamine-hydrolysing)